MCDYRESRERWEWVNLAPYASHSSDPSLIWRRSENETRVDYGSPRQPRPVGTHFPELESSEIQTQDLAGALSRFKTAFQVDKERIASSTAFRRLEYKTQMFVSHEGDHFRTRLTHTIEVDETARFIAQALRLNEDLVEAIALGHDLGHTPIGHSGEATLDRMFQKYWPGQEPYECVNGETYGPAFYHNVQSVRVVDTLEKGYEWDLRPNVRRYDLDNPPAVRGRGMDLTWAVREGILKHSSRGLKAGQRRMYGSQYLMAELEPFQPATLEGQAVEFADEVTSLMHDLADGLRSRLFTLSDLREGLLKWIHVDELPDLLGLTARLGHTEDPLGRSRVRKLLELLEVIRQGDDCTVGIVLAFLRSVLISNLVEASYSRLLRSMAGGAPDRLQAVPRVTVKAGPPDLLWVHINIGRWPGPTRDSYCPQAWEVNPAECQTTLQTFRRSGNRVQPTSDLAWEPARLWWVMKSLDPFQSREVIVERGDGKVWAYPLGSVCLTYGGAHLVGYDENLLGLRDWLRGQFIPDYLHHNSTVLRMNDKGQRFLADLFALYYSTPSLMHRSALERYQMWQAASASPEALQQRKSFVLRIVEHLQGMTDRYLEQEYARLFMPGGSVSERDEVGIVDGGRPPFEAPQAGQPEE